jgi:hypothetical protein
MWALSGLLAASPGLAGSLAPVELDPNFSVFFEDDRGRPIVGLPVELSALADPALARPKVRVVTDGNGVARFRDVRPGSYVVGRIMTAGWAPLPR